MTSFGELQISFLLFSAPKIPQMTSYPAASTAEKSIKTSFFYYKDKLHFFLDFSEQSKYFVGQK
jgi:hypothetical protein